MSKTTNLQLEKPDNSEFYDIQVMNDNMDKIDGASTWKAVGNAPNKQAITLPSKYDELLVLTNTVFGTAIIRTTCVIPALALSDVACLYYGGSYSEANYGVVTNVSCNHSTIQLSEAKINGDDLTAQTITYVYYK